MHGVQAANRFCLVRHQQKTAASSGVLALKPNTKRQLPLQENSTLLVPAPKKNMHHSSPVKGVFAEWDGPLALTAHRSRVDEKGEKGAGSHKQKTFKILVDGAEKEFPREYMMHFVMAIAEKRYQQYMKEALFFKTKNLDKTNNALVVAEISRRLTLETLRDDLMTKLDSNPEKVHTKESLHADVCRAVSYHCLLALEEGREALAPYVDVDRLAERLRYRATLSFHERLALEQKDDEILAKAEQDRIEAAQRRRTMHTPEAIMARAEATRKEIEREKAEMALKRAQRSSALSSSAFAHNLGTVHRSDDFRNELALEAAQSRARMSAMRAHYAQPIVASRMLAPAIMQVEDPAIITDAITPETHEIARAKKISLREKLVLLARKGAKKGVLSLGLVSGALCMRLADVFISRSILDNNPVENPDYSGVLNFTFMVGTGVLTHVCAQVHNRLS